MWRTHIILSHFCIPPSLPPSSSPSHHPLPHPSHHPPHPSHHPCYQVWKQSLIFTVYHTPWCFYGFNAIDPNSWDFTPLLPSYKWLQGDVCVCVCVHMSACVCLCVCRWGIVLSVQAKVLWSHMGALSSVGCVFGCDLINDCVRMPNQYLYFLKASWKCHLSIILSELILCAFQVAQSCLINKVELYSSGQCHYCFDYRVTLWLFCYDKNNWRM